MQRWEYKRWISDVHEVADDTFEGKLNALGAEGWDLVASFDREQVRHQMLESVHAIREAGLRLHRPQQTRRARSEPAIQSFAVFVQRQRYDDFRH